MIDMTLYPETYGIFLHTDAGKALFQTRFEEAISSGVPSFTLGEGDQPDWIRVPAGPYEEAMNVTIKGWLRESREPGAEGEDEYIVEVSLDGHPGMVHQDTVLVSAAVMETGLLLVASALDIVTERYTAARRNLGI